MAPVADDDGISSNVGVNFGDLAVKTGQKPLGLLVNFTANGFLIDDRF